MAMGDLQHSEELSEERTEPFSQSEFEYRQRSMRANEPTEDDELHYNAVPLNLLKVEDHHHKKGIRILVRPLTRSRSVSPGNGSCQWLAFRAEVASQDEPQHKVLAVTQTSKDIKFSVRIPSENLSSDEVPRPPLWCELYYDPASDNQILLNRSEVPITLTSLSLDPVGSPGPIYDINPFMTKALTPGSWRIGVEDISVLDFRVLQKAPLSLLRRGQLAIEDASASSTTSDYPNSSGKRSLATEDSYGEKRMRTSQEVTANKEDGVIMFLRPAAEPLVLPMPKAQPTPAAAAAQPSRELVPANSHALLDVQQGETVEINGGCEIDEYTVTKCDQIAGTALSSVYTAHYSNVPEDIVTVKVLKTRPANNPSQKPQEVERNVIRQADMCLREYQSQDHLRHDSIVRLYGGDARFLSLYMEHVDARDLAARNVWRSPHNDLFQGTRVDAMRILRDVASALHYLHDQRLVHNDIKPANVLYSPDRGAVLCDFGLSTLASNPATTGGTPYYVPPEFIGRRQRGAPSDVWALGITMLYVLRHIPFPDARVRQAHPKPLYWLIADVNRSSASRQPNPRVPGVNQRMSAADQMSTWLSEVREAANRLDRHNGVERLVYDMLLPNPSHRITTARIVRDMRDMLDERGRPLLIRQAA